MRRLDLRALFVLVLALSTGCGEEAAPAARGQASPASEVASRVGSSRVETGRGGTGQAGTSQAGTGLVDEVLANILDQPVGAFRLADYDLPEPFLRRIVDRIIRDSYQASFYTVYDDGQGGAFPAPAPPPRDAARGAALVTVIAPERPRDLVARRPEQDEARPPRRGYRPGDGEPWDADGPGADIVAQRLARDGLLSTLAQVLEAAADLRGQDDDALLAALRAAGLPVDLLDHFALSDDRPPGPAIDIVRHVARLVSKLGAGETAATLADDLAALPFTFSPAHPGFRVASESGAEPLGMLRLQLTRGDYWQTPGEGGSLDVLQQMLARLPDVSFVASVEDRFVEPIVALAGAWPLGPAGRLTLIREPLVVAQWAQDNGKAGVVSPGDTWATIVPRYASRRDDGSLFVPGESSLVGGLAAAGQVIVRSPLLFQGGNLLVVRHPVSGERIMLVGEAEIHRNTALGLTAAQAEAAFRAEFAVDRVVVLPSVSFHLDYDVSVRGVGTDLVAFVNDPVAAARGILRCALPALRDSNAMSPEDADAAESHLVAGRDRALASVVGNALVPFRTNEGFPSSLAYALSTGPADSPIGNLHRLMLAIDILMSTGITDAELPPAGASRAYVEAMRRIDSERVALHEVLRGLGWKVVPVPSLAAGGRSINYVNGIHDRTHYLMPAVGGLYAPLDATAAEVFAAHLGPEVEIIPIYCAESQRRSGAVHCSASAYPAR